MHFTSSQYRCSRICHIVPVEFLCFAHSNTLANDKDREANLQKTLEYLLESLVKERIVQSQNSQFKYTIALSDAGHVD